jgi:hypothetical protein
VTRQATADNPLHGLHAWYTNQCRILDQYRLTFITETSNVLCVQKFCKPVRVTISQRCCYCSIYRVSVCYCLFFFDHSCLPNMAALLTKSSFRPIHTSFGMHLNGYKCDTLGRIIWSPDPTGVLVSIAFWQRSAHSLEGTTYL